ncbi:S28 family serine protease [Brumimicrobium oceani]|nr:S28 family serine protease [Brumimicrobium oceani]
MALFICLNLIAQPSITERISKIDNIAIAEISTKDGFSKCFEIMFRQPVNHSDTSEGFFYQKMYLSHKSIDKPMVLNVNGYVSSSNRISDWTHSLDANQIYVEHRYFGESKPKKMNYEHLNMLNSVSDLHCIKMAFSQIYQNGWVSVGVSKGGLTALSYKYFYPDDIDATIALSTSVKTSECDSSFFNFIDSLNSNQGCKDELDSFQRLLLKEKDNIIPYLNDYLIQRGKSFDHLGLTTIYEIAVLEIPFSIWQNGKGCQTIDFSVYDPKSLFNEMRKSLNGWFMTDEVFTRINSYHIQALTELGYYCYPVTRFSNLLESDFEKLTPVHPIEGVKISYSNELMTQIKKWAITKGNRVIYISGGNDPYSKYRIVPLEGVNAKSFLLEGKNHNEVYNYYIDSATYDEIKSLIINWIE